MMKTTTFKTDPNRSPLDFSAVTDHAEFLGEIKMCMTPGSKGYWHPVCLAQIFSYRRSELGLMEWWERSVGDLWRKLYGLHEQCRQMGRHSGGSRRSLHRSSSCKFAALLVMRTGTIGAGQNLHHNVIFVINKFRTRPNDRNSLTNSSLGLFRERMPDE